MIGDLPGKPSLLECLTAAVRVHNERHGIRRTSARKSAPDDESRQRLMHMALRMMHLHGAFADKGIAGVRDDDDRSVPLVLALKCMAALEEHHR